ncbi:hypothetical protein DNAM5_39 [Haloarcula californiae tailed virus 1]|uniref:Uncharacterized protein n=1 Tax=Haloarcula californiae tailed virus 1 TaxID=1273746 RepID=R4TMH1_9CAUD|nr:hypothetical protein M202_gp039 [Haloarcula californiae tailed virus 1]AGM11902.1 hypothetical protein DNAM5_39 [Haloarcula californiae tailed virus 1]UBF23024.1 hypothetical protein HCTV-16_gp41 [Haloarcula virus HCTV-16]
MTQDLLTDLGEEYLMKNGLDGVQVTIGLYNDSSDQLGDSSDVSDITTEPDDLPPGYNYTRQSATVEAADISGNWGVDNASKITFDLSGSSTSNDVDTAFVLIDFQASDTGDSASNEHLVANPALSQTRDIGSIDTLEIAAGDLEIKVD